MVHIQNVKSSNKKGKMEGEMEDITSWIKGAVSGKLSISRSELMEGLPVGEMIKKSDLPLVDAMNSIELFNPKMDTGMAGPSSSSTSQASGSSQEARPKLFEPLHSFTPEEILWIMDEMLSAEVRPLQRSSLTSR
jgi:hypothetical protein